MSGSGFPAQPSVPGPVPGNRWDRFDGITPPEPPLVSVVIPYFEDAAGLDRVLTALAYQTHPVGCLEAVIADDGSARRPEPGSRPFPVTVVHQPDRGFRAAAARNLGAGAATGEVLCFLDGDTVPEPGYVAAACRLPALCPDAVVVGRRRHGDVEDWDAGRIAAWCTGAGPAPTALPEPAWLADGYRTTANLLWADDRSYRFVISAVLTLPARLFAEVGGFDESFVGYGGEDWELANRLWLAGAVLAHEPAAVAWHAGPGTGEATSPSQRAAKHEETRRLAELITEPGARGRGVVRRQPDAVVELAVDGHPEAAVVCSVISVLAQGDVGVWLQADGHEGLAAAAAVSGGWFGADPRVHVGPVPDEVAARSRYRVRLRRPLALEDGSLTAWTDRVATGDLAALQLADLESPLLDICATRATARHRRWSRADLFTTETLRVTENDGTGGYALLDPPPRVEDFLAATTRANPAGAAGADW